MARLAPPSLLSAVLLAALFAGCGGPSFSVDVSLWKAGFAWEYQEEVLEETRIDGEPPGSVEDFAQEGAVMENRTLRFEVFNSTAASVEGIPIYAMAVLNRLIPDENATEPQEEEWDAWVFSADLNYVEPTYLDWRNQEVQLSGDEGGVGESPEPRESPTDSPIDDASQFNEIRNEHRRLDWPLTKGHEWRHVEPVLALGGLDGVYQARAGRLANFDVPAGRFQAVLVEGTLAPFDISEIEDAIRQSLESQGGQVRSLSFMFRVEFDYAYSDQVKNFVQYEQVQLATLQAAGVDQDGQDYDFTFTQSETMTRRLTTHQLSEGVEKPLSFAIDVKRGIYSPKPITPASHLAVEALVTRQDLNRLDDTAKANLGVRIYNSTAGEKKLRNPESSYPAVVDASQFNPDYDHEMLEVVWVLENIGAQGQFVEFHREVQDQLQVTARTFPTAGLKQVRAILKLKDSGTDPGQEIFTDFVYFEVYSRGNLTYERLATNVTGTGPQIFVKFPVEPTATRVYIQATLVGAPQDAQCPVPFGGGGGLDCLRVRDRANRPVTDERGDRMKFETTRIAQYALGDWTAEYANSAPGQKVTFEVIVRYRPGF